jgi:glycine cleavage system aminomethyltransferase T
MRNQTGLSQEFLPRERFVHSPYVPFYSEEILYIPWDRPFIYPFEYTGWRDEVLSWKKTCYIHANLNPSRFVRMKGPDVLRFLSDTFVNAISNFPIGSGKHGCMCNDKGQICADGVIIRTGEYEFDTYFMAPYMTYAIDIGKYDVEYQDLSAEHYLFQVAGPRSLEILEKVTGDDLHDIKFMRYKESGIGDKRFRVLRMGMAGSLAYELHGHIKDATEVYDAIYQTGKEFGIRRLGLHAYMLNHTENGFPQFFYHFPLAWTSDANYKSFMAERGIDITKAMPDLAGSMGTDIEKLYRTPIELGWSNLIRFDHNFVGRGTLEKESVNPRRKMVTLVWEKEDLLDIYASQFEKGEPYANMDEPNHFTTMLCGKHIEYSDKVLSPQDEYIGISSGRAFSFYYRDMISLCSIDVAYSSINSEVVVLWGNPGTRQKKIRAKVSRFPYYDENRNQSVDVNLIPHIN